MTLFDPVTIGNITLSNRVVMAPLTRNRAESDGTPNALMNEYYTQRAGAGLIITEGTQPDRFGQGYPNTPGLHNEQQHDAWKKITRSVHEQGGKIFLQVMHAGRISHPDTIGGTTPIAPSAVKPEGVIPTMTGMKSFETPKALATKDIPKIIDQYRDTTILAKTAGFDGVELHAANGYLPNQFLATNTNQRTDKYGGSVENRARFVLKAFEAMAGAWKENRVGIRISPGFHFNDIYDADPTATYDFLVKQLEALNPAYVHVERGKFMGPCSLDIDVVEFVRKRFTGNILAAAGYDQASAEAEIASGKADMVAFGKAFISNPDLVERFRQGAPLAPWNDQTFYTPGPEGYTDYPTMNP